MATASATTTTSTSAPACVVSSSGSFQEERRLLMFLRRSTISLAISTCATAISAFSDPGGRGSMAHLWFCGGVTARPSNATPRVRPWCQHSTTRCTGKQHVVVRLSPAVMWRVAWATATNPCFRSRNFSASAVKEWDLPCNQCPLPPR